MRNVSVQRSARRPRAVDLPGWRVLSSRLRRAAIGLASALVSVLLANSFVSPATAEPALQTRLASLRDRDVIAGGHLASIDALRMLYACRTYRPIWTTEASVAALRDAVTTSWVAASQASSTRRERERIRGVACHRPRWQSASGMTRRTTFGAIQDLWIGCTDIACGCPKRETLTWTTQSSRSARAI